MMMMKSADDERVLMNDDDEESAGDDDDAADADDADDAVAKLNMCGNQDILRGTTLEWKSPPLVNYTLKGFQVDFPINLPNCWKDERNHE